MSVENALATIGDAFCLDRMGLTRLGKKGFTVSEFGMIVVQ